MNVKGVFFASLVVALGTLSLLILLPFLSYVLAAVLLAFVLFPAHRRFRSEVDERISALGLVSATVLVTLLPLLVVLRSVVANLSALPGNPEAFRFLGTLETTVTEVTGVDVPLRSVVSGVPEQLVDTLTGFGLNVAGAGVHFGVGVLLLVFLVYYLLVDGAALVAWTKQVTPLPPDVQEELYAEANATTWAVLKGHVFVAVVQGVAAGLGLLATGVPNAGLWTLVMIFLGFLPVVGVPLVWGPAAVYLGVVGRPLTGVLLVLYGVTLVAVVDDYLRAYLVDRESSMHAATILVGVLGAVYAFGAMGLFLGPVVLGLFKSTVEVANRHYDVRYT